MMSIVHNMEMMNTNRQFGIVNGKKSKIVEKLSSGYRINRAADDAAGLAISEKMRRQIRGLTQGVLNTQDGVSMSQVADGALEEVSDMLHRITELAVKASNGTNSREDREYIQEEVKQILNEIDRIGETTTFNEEPIFKGTDQILYNSDGSTLQVGDIPMRDFVMADVDLGVTPFGQNSPGYMLGFQAIVKNTDSAANNIPYNLIYGGGNTSHTSFRLQYEVNGQTRIKVADLRSMQVLNYNYSEIAGIPTWKREFCYTNEDGVDFTVRQTVKLYDGVDEKHYELTYSMINESDFELQIDEMIHFDTAYNNNDHCEGYFNNNQRITENTIYNFSGSPYMQGMSSANIVNTAINSISVVDIDAALAFTENISFSPTEFDLVSVGYYASICNWDYYDRVSSELGQTTNREDLGISLLHKVPVLANGEMTVSSLNYGIVNVSQDINVSSIPIQRDEALVTQHLAQKKVWIQSGCDVGSGLWITFDEMNTDVLGISRLNVSTINGAERALDSVKGALKNVMSNRSKIGAQQNRLEHIIANENNVVENTTAAESRIRDTDMAKEIVDNSTLEILRQAGETMMSHGQKDKQYVLNLLQ